jgi:diguanylate cyclase (GGDEF)-like protein/PAS domain S-box-containing protein
MFEELLSTPLSGDFMPHGMCLLWRPALLWLHVASDLLITAAYYAIPVMLAYFASKRKDLEFRWMFILFAVFIVACGTTHLMAVWTIWHPDYLADGIVKLITAVSSVGTAILLRPLIPQALALTSPATLREANTKLQAEIDARLRSEAALRESEERWQFALEGAGAGVWDYNLQTHEVMYSKRYKEMYNLVADQNGKVHHEWKKCVHPEDMARLLGELQAYLDGISPAFACEYRMRCEDGGYRWILDRAMLISRTEDGKPLRMIGTHSDITDRKALEKKLIVEILDASPEAELLVNAEGSILFANGASERVFGYAHAELAGMNVDALVPDPARATHSRQRADYLRAPAPRPMGLNRELFATRRDGSTIPVEIALSPIELDKQTVIIATVVDITERKRSEAAIQAANELNRQIIESAREGIVGYDLEGRFSIWNPFMEEITGIEKRDCLGKPPCDVFPFLKNTGIPEGIQRALAGETVKNPPFPWSVPETGRSGWASSIIAPLYGNDERIIGVIETVSDITEARAKEERLRLIAETITEVFWMADAELETIDYVSPAYEELWRRSCGELYENPQAFLDAVHPEDRDLLERTYRERRMAGDAFDVEFRLHQPDGSIRWILNRCFPVREESGPAHRYVGVATDITERKQTEFEMRLAATVYKAIGEAIMVADAGNRIVAINPAFTKLTGYSEAEAVGQSTSLLKSGRQDAAFYKNMWLTLEKTGHWQGEIWNRRKNGEVYLEWLSISTIYDPQGKVLQRVATFSDITDQKRAEQIIWRQANFDPLTELPNRSMFYDRLDMEMKNSKRSGAPLALMFLDLDRFKGINDTLGHDMGDILLKEAARRLSGCVREIDTVARLGGDEFTVILGELGSPAVIDRVAHDILEKLAKPFPLGNETGYVSSSLGITLYPQDADSIDELLKNADQAMYAAKNQGGNRYRYFTPSMQEAAQVRMRLSNDLRGALAGRQFLIHYQPIVELATGIIHKAEALLRWQHPSKGLISPAEFIPIAEETGLIMDIGDWVFREAARQAVAWSASRRCVFQVSVNISPVQFRNEGQATAAWPGYLRELGLAGQNLAMEITEGLLLEASPEVSRQLLAFRDAGIQVAIDDFGTGYSALSYLKKFDIDYLKIDQSFIRNLAPDSGELALCEAITAMAHKLGLKVIAEGVETAGQYDLLKDIGCDYGQGYLFSKPLSVEAFEALPQDLVAPAVPPGSS